MAHRVIGGWEILSLFAAGAMACSGDPNLPPGSGGRAGAAGAAGKAGAGGKGGAAGSAGVAGSSSGRSGAAGNGGESGVGEGGEGASAGTAGRGGSGGKGGSGGRGGTGGAGRAGSGGGGGSGGTAAAGNGGTGATGAGASGEGGIGEGGVSGTAGSAGFGGTAGTGGAGTCMKVTEDGDDALASASDGASPFATIQAAIDFADAHPQLSRSVCVASAACCEDGCTLFPAYTGPGGNAITMRDGVWVSGGYAKDTWAQCAPYATLDAGVRFQSDVASATELARFRLMGHGITIDGATGAAIRAARIDNTLNVADFVGVDVSGGAVANLSSVSVFSEGLSSGNVLGVRSVGSRVSLAQSRIELYLGGGTVNAVWLENSPGSVLDTVNIILYATAGGSLTAIRVLGDGEAVRISGGSVAAHADAFAPLSMSAVELLDADGVEVTDLSVSARDATAGITGVHAVRSRVTVDATISVEATGSSADGVLLDDSPGSTVTGSVTAQADANATGVSVTGDGTGVEIRLATIAAVSSDGEAIGLRLQDCAGASPLVTENAVISASTGSATLPSEGIRAAGDCHPRIESNTLIAALGTGQAMTTTGIRCTALASVPSRCTILGNADIHADNPRNTPGPTAIGTGIRCEAGSCESIEDNTVDGLLRLGSCKRSCGYVSYGVYLDTANPLVARNVIRAGCGGRAVGLRALASTSRVENNRIYGRSDDGPCGTSGTNAEAHVLESRGAWGDNLDFHSNDVWAGGSRNLVSGSCTSIGVELGGASTVRNNVVRSGSCMMTYAAANAGPATLQNNDLVPGGLAVYFDGTQRDIDYVNALPNAAGNFSLDPGMTVDGHLLAGSPCIDSGTIAGAPATDRDGEQRDIAPDVGPDEYVP